VKSLPAQKKSANKKEVRREFELPSENADFKLQLQDP
jgi:hypothetical protein